MKIFKLLFNNKGEIKKTSLVATTKKQVACKRNSQVSEYGNVCFLSIRTTDGLNMARVNAKNELEAKQFLKEALND